MRRVNADFPTVPAALTVSSGIWGRDLRLVADGGLLQLLQQLLCCLQVGSSEDAAVPLMTCRHEQLSPLSQQLQFKLADDTQRHVTVSNVLKKPAQEVTFDTVCVCVRVLPRTVWWSQPHCEVWPQVNSTGESEPTAGRADRWRHA